jgi:SAM-dependent methyltransferase
MHDTAQLSGHLFALTYGRSGDIVVDVGGKNVNGSLREYFTKNEMKYISVDLEEDPSVDIIIKPGDKLPFEDQSVDLVVSTSCFEHDPIFWMTFKEMCRIVKLNGFIYINVPSNGVYHCYPGDNWRFYSDAGQALAYWSGIQLSNETVYPVKVMESFHILPVNDIWTDFICVWQRVNTKENNITISQDIINNNGLLERLLHLNNVNTNKKFNYIHNKI